MSFRLFLSHVATAPAPVVLSADRALVQGLPLVKTGVWNNVPITSDDLDAAVRNFATLATEHGWLPGGWPKHPDEQGPAGRNALDRLAIVQNVYREQDQLKADVMLLGKEAVDAYKAGKLPYVSSELDWRYSVTGGGRQLPGMTLTGYAWVDDPGVKGMSAELFMNAADFKQVWPANEPKKENRPMTIKERMKAAFAAMRGGMSAEEAAQAEADINALPDVDPVALTNDQTPAPAVTPGAPAVTPGAPAVTPKGGTDFAAEVAALRAQLATQKQANATLTETVAQLAKNTREAANANAVDALCNSGNLPPAKAPLLKAILNNLPSTEAKVAYMAKGADGAEVSTEVDLHGAILQLANSEDYKALFASSGGVAPALESSPQAAGLSDEDVDGLVSSVRRTVDEGK